MKKQIELWPYLLFLPIDIKERYTFIRKVLSSKVAASVFSQFETIGKVYQKDLIENLPHSNKSILSFLSTLRKYGLIISDSEVQAGKRVVVHKLTKSGWEFSKFFSEELPADIGDLTISLLEEYLYRLIMLHREQKLPESMVSDSFTRARAKAYIHGSMKYLSSDVVIVSPIVYDSHLSCESYPKTGGVSECQSITSRPASIGFDVAKQLASSAMKVKLVSELGNDQNGWNILTELIQSDVDVTGVAISDRLHTPKSYTISTVNDIRRFTEKQENSAFTKFSPSAIPWDDLESSSIIFLSEVPPDIGSTISLFARARNIPVIFYCPSISSKRKLDDYASFLSLIDVMILSNETRKSIRSILNGDPISFIRPLTSADIIIRNTKQSYKHYSLSRGITTKSTTSHGDIPSEYLSSFLEAMTEQKKPFEAHMCALDNEK
jgi:hypothetical protein